MKTSSISLRKIWEILSGFDVIIKWNTELEE